MNRKQRRIMQAQSKPQATINFRGKTYAMDEAVVLAVKEHDLKNFPAALEIYNLIIAQIPDYAAVYSNRAFTLQEMQRYDEALASCDKAIAIQPDLVQAHINRALTLQSMKRFDEALVGYDTATAIQPHYVNTYINRGQLLHEMHRFDDALASYDKALAINPHLAIAHNNRGHTLQAMKRHGDALTCYDKALALNPEVAEFYNNRGIVLHEMRRLDDALKNYTQAIARKPDYAEAYRNYGLALAEMQRYDESLASYDKAIAAQPDFSKSYSERGSVLLSMKRHEEALADFKKASTLKPEIPYLAGMMLLTQMTLCKWQESERTIATVAKGIKAGSPVSTPFAILATPLSPAYQRKCAEILVEHQYPPAVAALWNGERYSHDRIRLGYFSADFYDHATAYLMAGLFELHDRSKFEIIAFSFGPPSNHAMRTRVEKAFDRFIDVSAKTDMEIAALARSLEIDIAIDLKGFTKDARTGIFAFRPAPVQVNYLGYPGTMGARYIDYIIADPVMIPPEHQSYYTEKIVYLPDSYQVNDSTRKISDRHYTRQEMGLPENGFVFCCFNNNFKITPDIFDIWMRLLHKVDDSVLWLFEDNPVAANNLRVEAEARGISADRLVFAPRMELPEHLARHRLADLFLDTFYCNAHTTASDALWAGLPLLTCLGETFAARVAASLLHAVGLPELVTHSHEEYEATALKLATTPPELSLIRHKLAQNRTTTPLFNTKLFTGHIEEAYRKMHEKGQAGMPPDHIWIEIPSSFVGEG